MTTIEIPYTTETGGKEHFRFPIGVTKINLRRKGITSIKLTALKYCTNLEALWLGGNQLTVIDLSPLQHCTNLQQLSLFWNRLTTVDLSPLQHCPNLIMLWIGGNPLVGVDLTPLQHCTNLLELFLAGNQLTMVDLTPLQHCTNLHQLLLNRNQLTIVDLTPLQHCTKLGALRLDENPLVEVDLSPLFLCSKLYTSAFDTDVILTANPLLKGRGYPRALEEVLGRIVWRGPIGKPWPSYPQGMVLHSAIEIEEGPIGEGFSGEVFRAKLIQPYGGWRRGIGSLSSYTSSKS